MKTNVTISISTQLAERIHRFSRKQEITKSRIHTEAIEEWLQKFEEQKDGNK